mgnify:CR=1 FL=1
MTDLIALMLRCETLAPELVWVSATPGEAGLFIVRVITPIDGKAPQVDICIPDDHPLEETAAICVCMARVFRDRIVPKAGECSCGAFIPKTSRSCGICTLDRIFGTQVPALN